MRISFITNYGWKKYDTYYCYVNWSTEEDVWVHLKRLVDFHKV